MKYYYHLRRRFKDGTGGHGFEKEPRSIRELSATEAAWVGAFIDGEGNVGISAQNKNTGWVNWEVTAGNTEVELIATLVRLVGGGAVRLQKIGSGTFGEKPLWRWYLRRANDVLALAEQVAPYSLKFQRLLEQFPKP